MIDSSIGWSMRPYTGLRVSRGQASRGIDLFEIALLVDEVMRCFRACVRSCRGAGALAPSEGVLHSLGDIPG